MPKESRPIKVNYIRDIINRSLYLDVYSGFFLPTGQFILPDYFPIALSLHHIHDICNATKGLSVQYVHVSSRNSELFLLRR